MKRPARHHGDPVADPEQLGEIRADDQDRLALRGQLAEQAIDLGLGADVDAAGRLVEQQDVGLLVQQPRQGHLLLVAAREAATPAGPGRSPRSVSRAIQPRDLGTALLEPQPAVRRVPPQARSMSCYPRSSGPGPAPRPCGPRSGTRAPARSARGASRSRPRRGATRIRPATTGSSPKTARSSRRPARADQSRDAEDLAATQHQVRRPAARAGPEVLQLQDRLARRVRHAGEQLVEVAPDHVPDDRSSGRVSARSPSATDRPSRSTV